MYIPKKFVESDFVSYTHLKYESMTPNQQKIVDATLFGIGAVIGIAFCAVLNKVANKTILKNDA